MIFFWDSPELKNAKNNYSQYKSRCNNINSKISSIESCLEACRGYKDMETSFFYSFDESKGYADEIGVFFDKREVHISRDNSIISYYDYLLGMIKAKRTSLEAERDYWKNEVNRLS